MDTWLIAWHAIEHFLTTESMTRTIVISLLASFAGTQWIKRWALPVIDLWRKFPEAVERAFIAGVAYIIAALVALSLGASLLLSLILGASSPSAYMIVVRTAYHFFPWLEPKISAQSLKRIRRANGTEQDVPVDHPTDHEAVDYTIMAPRDRE